MPCDLANLRVQYPNPEGRNPQTLGPKLQTRYQGSGAFGPSGSLSTRNTPLQIPQPSKKIAKQPPKSPRINTTSLPKATTPRKKNVTRQKGSKKPPSFEDPENLPNLPRSPSQEVPWAASSARASFCFCFLLLGVSVRGFCEGFWVLILFLNGGCQFPGG